MSRLCLLLMLSLSSLLRAGTAEIKLLIAEDMRPAAMKVLKMKAEGAPEVSVCFYDTAEGALDTRGLILRVRREHEANAEGEKELDAVVKRRGDGPAPGRFKDLKPEEDWVGPESMKLSFSIKAENLDESLVMEVLEGKKQVREALSDQQQQFAKACLNLPEGAEVPWKDLRRYGVIAVWKSKRDIGEFQKAAVEYWRLTPEKGPVVELLEVSVKVKADTPEEIKAQAVAFYAAAKVMGLGVPAGASKTSRVMEVLKPGK